MTAFLAASRGGDINALLAVLDPGVTFRADKAAVKAGASSEVHGAALVAKFFSGRAQSARTALVNGAVGVVVAPRGRLLLVLGITIARGKIIEIESVADPERLGQLELAIVDDIRPRS